MSQAPGFAEQLRASVVEAAPVSQVVRDYCTTDLRGSKKCAGSSPNDGNQTLLAARVVPDLVMTIPGCPAVSSRVHTPTQYRQALSFGNPGGNRSPLFVRLFSVENA